MSQEMDARNANSHDPNGDEQDLAATENGTTRLTNEERARYEQVQAGINAMILLEEEKEREKSESTRLDSDDDDLLLTLLPL